MTITIEFWTSLIALVFSAIAVAVTVYNAMLNRPRLRIRPTGPNLVITNGISDGPYFSVYVYNVGTQPTTISSIGLQCHKTKRGMLRGHSEDNFIMIGSIHSGSLPNLLGPGESLLYQSYFTKGQVDNDMFDFKHVQVLVHHTWSDRPKRHLIPNTLRRALSDRREQSVDV